MKYKAGFFKPEQKPEIIAEFVKESYAKSFIQAIELEYLTSRIYFYTDTETGKTIFFSESKFESEISKLKYYDCEKDKERKLSEDDIPQELKLIT